MKPVVAIFSSGEQSELCNEVVRLLGTKVQCKVWTSDIFSAGDVAIDAIFQIVKAADFSICVMTPDDEVLIRNVNHKIPRDNVMMEYGISYSVLGRNRAIALVEDHPYLKLPSNLAGITQERFDRNNMNPTISGLLKIFSDTGPIRRGEGKIKRRKIPGKRLFQHKGMYPIHLDRDNIPSVDPEIFNRAIPYLLNEVDDTLAAIDLTFLREDNIGHSRDPLLPENRGHYEAIIERYGLEDFYKDIEAQKASIFSNFIRVTNELGETFSGIKCEFVLHNVLNPLRSVIAAQNTMGISDRTLYRESTRFVVMFVKNQGADLIRAMETGGKIAYKKTLHKWKDVKATTTPFYDYKFGLVAILCVNIDIDYLSKIDEAGALQIIEAYSTNSGYTPDFEK